MGAEAAYDALGEAATFRIRRYILSCRWHCMKSNNLCFFFFFVFVFFFFLSAKISLRDV